MNKYENFEAFYEEYLGFSIRLARNVVKNEETAKDISQEVFCHLYEIFPTLDLSDQQKLRALVTIATINKAKDYLRKPYVVQETGILGREDQKPTFSAENLEEMLLKAEQNEKKRKALRELYRQNPENYEILMKVKYYELPPQQVAREHHMSVNALNNRILRTRLWLKKQLFHI